jgi:hypothetical protein
MGSALKSSVVHPLGKMDRQVKSPPTAKETEQFCRGLFFACIFEIVVVAAGAVLWRMCNF